MSKGLWYNAEMFYYSLLWSSADFYDRLPIKMEFMIRCHSIFLAKRSCLCLEWQESIRRYPKHSKESAAMMRGTLNVILNEREGSVPVVRKVVRRYQSNRFFALWHIAGFHLSRKVFLPKLWMTIRGKAPQWQKTLIVILNRTKELYTWWGKPVWG